MSSIAAGTTTTTGYVVTSDSTGALVLKTGASATTALTIDTSQNVTFVGSQTLSAGTANGVLYLNGSKVVTSGSALTFSGTNLGVSGNGAFNTGASGGVISGTSTYSGYFSALGGGSGAIISITPDTISGANGATYNTSFVSGGSGPHVFQIGGSEQMRLTSTGLGIGTSSPSEKLHVAGALRVTGAQTSAGTGIYLDYGSITGAGGVNVYGPDTSTQGIWRVYTATSNGGTGSEKARISSNGNMGIGTASPSQKLTIGQTNGYPVIDFNNSGTVYGDVGFQADKMVLSAYSTTPLTFFTNAAERARIDSSGNLLVGATTGTDGKIKVDGTTNANNCAVWAKNSAGSSSGTYVCWNAATTGDNKFIDFYTEASAALRGSISYNRAGGLTAYNTTSDYRAKDISGPVVDSGALIDSVPVYMGKMKGATQERPMFIAHETPEYAHTGEKDAVDADGNPVYQQMDGSALIPVMWAEIQSLRQRITALEGR
jgi:hypothetical protein